MPPLLEVAQQLVTQQVLWLQTLIMLPVDAAPSIVTASAFWLQQENVTEEMTSSKTSVVLHSFSNMKLLSCYLALDSLPMKAMKATLPIVVDSSASCSIIYNIGCLRFFKNNHPNFISGNSWIRSESRWRLPLPSSVANLVRGDDEQIHWHWRSPSILSRRHIERLNFWSSKQLLLTALLGTPSILHSICWSWPHELSASRHRVMWAYIPLVNDGMPPQKTG